MMMTKTNIVEFKIGRVDLDHIGCRHNYLTPSLFIYFSGLCHSRNNYPSFTACILLALHTNNDAYES